MKHEKFDLRALRSPDVAEGVAQIAREHRGDEFAAIEAAQGRAAGGVRQHRGGEQRRPHVETGDRR